MRFRGRVLALAMSFALLVPAAGFAVAGPAEEKRIERLERQVEELRTALAALRSEQPEDVRIQEIKRRLDVLAGEIERIRAGEAVVTADRSEHGLGPAASKIYRAEPGVSLGGYGEALLRKYDDTRDDGAPSGKTDTFDLLRVVLYAGYKFNDRFLLNTEIEFEHASTGGDGEVSVEFAYVDYLGRPELGVRAGLVLMPVGFVNELHEPTTFLGATRPEVERFLIPTTWREIGAGVFGKVGDFSYRSYVVTALDATGFSASGIRGGRQSGSKAKAEDFAWVGRADYEGVGGLLVGGSAYAGRAGQDLLDGAGRKIGARTTLIEGHAQWRHRGLEIRALAARAKVDDAARLNEALGLAGTDSVGSRLTGYYVQAGYDVLAGRSGERSLTPYLRWESLDTQHEVPAGFAADPANDRTIRTLGVEFRPIQQLVVKTDFQNVSNEAGTGVDRFHVALGYIF